MLSRSRAITSSDLRTGKSHGAITDRTKPGFAFLKFVPEFTFAG